MDSEVEAAYLSKYYHVSREELDLIKEYTRADLIEFVLKSMHEQKEQERIYGNEALNPGPLVHVLSVSVNRKKDTGKPLSIYGTITAENCDSVYGTVLRHRLYRRKRTNPEIIDTSGFLSLSSPDCMSHPDYAFIPMFKNRIVVRLFDGDNKKFLNESITLDDTEIEGGYQVVKSREISSKLGGRTLTLKYVAIPFGVHCRIEIKFYNRKDGEKHEYINVVGKVAASFKNTYGVYHSEKCVLFQTQSNSFERVDIEKKKMQLSRCWVAVPAYSSLLLHLNLKDDSGRELVNDDDATFLPGSSFGKLYKLHDLDIQVSAAWFSPLPLRPHKGNDVPKILSKNPTEEMDIDEDHTTSQLTEPPLTTSLDDKTEPPLTTSLDDKTSSSSNSWLRGRCIMPRPSPAFEIYSVLIGLEKSNAGAMKIHGSIEVLLDGKIISILEREFKAFAFSQNMNFMPIIKGSRVYEDDDDLEIKFDLKDADGRLAIRGRKVYGGQELEGTRYRDKQLCCLIQGGGGFAAVHYSIFDSAVAATINVFLDIKTGGGCPMICGSIFSRYRYYYDGSRYHKDCYRSALFVRNKDDSVQLNDDGSIPLSRSYVVVPRYSPLVINVDLSSSVLGCTEEIEIEIEIEIDIGEARKTRETSDYSIRIEVEWCEVE